MCVVERFELFVPFNFIRCLRCDKLLKKPVQEETKLLDGIFMPVFDDNQLNEIIGRSYSADLFFLNHEKSKMVVWCKPRNLDFG